MPNAGHILLADDDSDYTELVQIALRQAGIPEPVEVVKDGVEAVQYLKGEGAYADRVAHPIPFLVLLDLKLPGQSGFDVLRWIRRRPELRDVVVAVLSGWGFGNEEQTAYELGANSYIAKPAQFDRLVELLTDLREHWLQPERQLAASGKR
jgi:CheY-like chemotaxis protein